MLEPLLGTHGTATPSNSGGFMHEPTENVLVMGALVETICLECQLTPEAMMELLASPGFGAIRDGPSWQDRVPPEIIEAWECLSPDAAIVAFYMAVIQVRSEAAGR
jgi:hypothetical protein